MSFSAMNSLRDGTSRTHSRNIYGDKDGKKERSEEGRAPEQGE